MLARNGDDAADFAGRTDSDTFDAVVSPCGARGVPSLGRAGSLRTDRYHSVATPPSTLAQSTGGCLPDDVQDDFEDAMAGIDGDELDDVDVDEVRDSISGLDRNGQDAATDLIDDSGAEGVGLIDETDESTLRPILDSDGAGARGMRQRVADKYGDGSIDSNDVENFGELIEDSSVEAEPDTLLDVTESGGDLSSTRRAAEADGDVAGVESDTIWLEEGDSASGFEHILDRHANSDEFYDFSGVDNPDDVEEIVMNTIRKGDSQRIPDSEGGGAAFEYTLSSGDDVTVVVGDNGYIVTARPGEYT
ncbi:hypothetical protein [Haloarcula hispanica]|nr:hypothetical protein [Haloarcula hispanica]